MVSISPIVAMLYTLGTLSVEVWNFRVTLSPDDFSTPKHDKIVLLMCMHDGLLSQLAIHT